MIPVKLTLEGLYSYQERQTIDFTSLTAGGLFGIFGATGSGKSSILEAISFALYGDTERLDYKRRTYNMMNLKSDKVFIEFDFYNYQNKLYRVTREFKRNSKNFEDIRSPKTVFYESENAEWKPLTDTDATRIIGLPYHNFRRTIIIPQGKFREFIELGAKERTDMMKEIFNLHRFDLQEKVSALNRSNQSELDGLTALLEVRKAVTAEAVQSGNDELKKVNLQLGKSRSEHQVIENTFNTLRILKSDFDNLNKKKADFEKLAQREEEIQHAEKTLNDYDQVHRIFYQPLKDLEKRNNELGHKKSELQKTARESERLNSLLEAKNNALKEITPYFDQLPQKRVEEDDLKSIIQIFDLSAAVKKLESRKQNGEKAVAEVKEKVEQLHFEIKRSEHELQELKSKKPDTKLLREIGEWYHQQENLDQNYQRQNRKVSEKQTAIQNLIKELAQEHINLQTFGDEIQSLQEKLNHQTEKLNTRRELLLVQQKLAEHASSLHDGEACPLCGSMDHPHIIEVADVSEELIQINQELKNTEQERSALQKKESRFLTQQAIKQNLEKDLSAEKLESDQISRKIKAHHSAFIWKEFDSTDPELFRAKQKESDNLENLINQYESKLNETRKTEEAENKNLRRYQDVLDEIKTDEHTKTTQIQFATNNLKYLKPETYAGNSLNEVEDLLKRLQWKNSETEKQYQDLTKEINDLIPKNASQKKSLENLKERIKEIEQEATDISIQIDTHIKEEQLSGLTAIREILQRQIDVATERKRIEQFKIEFNSLKRIIRESEDKLAKVSFSEQSFEEEKKKWEISKGNLEAITKRSIELRSVTERLEKEYKEKLALQKKYDVLEKRSSNLRTLFNLLKGSGFVQYVSSIYLSQLCNHANERFQRMTRNQLSLRVNDVNDFEIVDYLNEGKSRSVKTLSGGQLFQVSLSLALALAESVQTHAKAEKKFFFIDEGFGTQDQESINTIFDALLDLNRENKIVGIISHVEELKERMPVSLLVERDPKRGSIVRLNR